MTGPGSVGLSLWNHIFSSKEPRAAGGIFQLLCRGKPGESLIGLAIKVISYKKKYIQFYCLGVQLKSFQWFVRYFEMKQTNRHISCFLTACFKCSTFCFLITTPACVVLGLISTKQGLNIEPPTRGLKDEPRGCYHPQSQNTTEQQKYTKSCQVTIYSWIYHPFPGSAGPVGAVALYYWGCEFESWLWQEVAVSAPAGGRTTTHFRSHCEFRTLLKF